MLVSPHRGEVEGGVPVPILRVDVGPATQEELHEFIVTVESRDDERRPPIGSARLDARALSQRRPDPRLRTALG